MSNPKIPERASPHLFQHATTCRTEDGFEFVIIAKSREELGQAWTICAGPLVPFDAGKISVVEIRKA